MMIASMIAWSIILFFTTFGVASVVFGLNGQDLVLQFGNYVLTSLDSVLTLETNLTILSVCFSFIVGILFGIFSRPYASVIAIMCVMLFVICGLVLLV